MSIADDQPATDDPVLDDAVLDNAVWHSLTGPHAGLAERHGAAVRYPPAVTPFVAVDRLDDRAWADLAALLGPGGLGVLFRAEVPPVPSGWTETMRGTGFQMVLGPSGLRSEGEVVPVRPLTEADVPAMLDLVARTRPGPFEARTIETGRYLGHVVDGRLLAMAGERLHPGGRREISAVCTDPDARGRGLAGGLVAAVTAGILDAGLRPLLHVAQDNDGARRVYERLGFVARRPIAVVVTLAPDTPSNPGANPHG